MPISLLLAGCGAEGSAPPAGTLSVTNLTLWLDYTPWGAHVPIFVAQSNGYFRDHGLNVTVRYPANVSDPLKLVAASSNTIGIGYMSDVVTAQAQGIPVQSIAALVQHHLNCIMSLKRSGISSPRQLAGKAIGAAETPADTVILNTVFKHAHVLGKVRRVNLNYNYVPALVDGQVDAIEGAYQVWERIQIEQLGHKVNVMQLQKWGVPDEYELVLLAGHSMAAQHPSVLRRFLAGLTEGERFALKHPDRAVATFLQDNPTYRDTKGRQLVRRSWRLLRPFMKPSHGPFGSQSPRRWHHLAIWMRRNHLVSRLVPNNRLFTNRFLT